MEVEKGSAETTEEAMECGTPKHTLSDSSSINSEPNVPKDEHDIHAPSNGNSEDLDADKAGKSQLSDDVVMTESLNEQENMQEESISQDDKLDAINYDDVLLLCDLFYLPFEHGKQGLMILNEFHWLKTNASVMSRENASKSNGNEAKTENKTVTLEWRERSKKFLKLCEAVFNLMKKIALCVNRELCYDLFTYCWEISSVVSICYSYVKWLELGQFPKNVNSYIQGNFTWFTYGFKETFMSGDQEPWIFRGGLVVDIQRLIPIDSGNDLFVYRLPETPTINFFSIRPYTHMDEMDVYKICQKTCNDGKDGFSLYPSTLQDIASDRFVGPFLTLNPEYCMVVENSKKNIMGYACAALNAKHFYRSMEVS
jgi:protein O-GlcNAcase/histone acetyltransferase